MKEYKIVAISDTHNRHKKITIPECDILIHCGDYSLRGHDDEIKRFYKWFNEQPAKHKISIQGNHEKGWESDPVNGESIALTECPDVILLHEESVEIEGIKIFGTPYTPFFCDWAYNRARNPAEAMQYKIPLIRDHYEKIPKDTDILITHGPPYGILDELVYANGDPKGQFVGCQDLLEFVKKIKPDLHFFGHIHCGHGEKHIDGTSFYNAAICDEMYWPSNPVTVVKYLTGD